MKRAKDRPTSLETESVLMQPSALIIREEGGMETVMSSSNMTNRGCPAWEVMLQKRNLSDLRNVKEMMVRRVCLINIPLLDLM